MPKEIDVNGLESLLRYLERRGNLKSMKETLSVYKEAQFISEFFKLALKTGPIGPQRSWIMRLAKGESFSIIAPPGLGKTTFGVISSVYLASKRKKKSLLMFPTKTLVNQVKQKVQQVASNTSSDVRLLVYDSGMKQAQRAEFMKSLGEEDFDIAILSSRFAMMNLENLSVLDFDFLFVDDVDSALKSNKSARTVTLLAGYTDEDIERVKELLKQSYNDPSAFSKIASLRKRDKVVVFSSATVNRSNPVLSSLMGFKPGSSNIYLRKVVDSFIEMPKDENSVIEMVDSLIKKLGSGGLIFVPVDKGNKYSEQVARELDGDLRVISLSSSSVRKIDEFKNGDVDVMVGVATHYGVLVRGIDIPCRIKYAIFLGIPKFRFTMGEAIHPLTALKLLTLIAQVRKDNSITSILYRAKRRLRRASVASLSMIARDIKDGKDLDPALKDMYAVLYENLKDVDVLEKISEIGDVVIEGNSIMMPDYITYVQASGRTSRLFGPELTTGLSIVFVENQNLFRMLQKKLSFVLDENNWSKLDLVEGKVEDIPLSQLMSKITRERKEIALARSSGSMESSLSKIKTTLMIVESPHKAKTISNFFSRPTVRETEGVRVFETVIGDKVLMVTASIGHVYDLTTEEKGLFGVEVDKKDGEQKFIPYYSTIKRCENGHQFTTDKDGKCPRCGGKVVSDKKAVIDGLRKLVMEADSVLIGTDPDTEGEKIAWDLYVSLRPFNNNIKRAEFHEITRRAILEAINNPREFIVPLVKSQIVRRVEDRWIGFKLSMYLRDFFWKDYCIKLTEKKTTSYLKEVCNKNETYYNLSAGRVQTPVLNWVVNRYVNEYKKTARKILVISAGSINFTVLKEKGMKKDSEVNVIVKGYSTFEEKFGPLPPYTTDTLLSDASQLLGISAQETMSIAQDLFESGLITYHRTDSTRVSNVGISVAENYLKQLLGYVPPAFKGRTWGEGGAHEAIRPTKSMDSDQLYTAIESGDIEPSKPFRRQHFRVYEIIFKRFLSSQLDPIIIERVKVDLEAEMKDGKKLTLESPVELPVSFRISDEKEVDRKLKDKIYVPFRIYKDVPEYLKSLQNNAVVKGKVIREFLKSDKPLYSEGDLVSEMKTKGIGRPSTYATIVGTLLRRRYVIESKKLKRLIPSNLGIAVNDYLITHYGKFVGEERTRQLLTKMDKVEKGEINYTDLLNELYKEIEQIDKLKETQGE
ncbi:Reverse gyrase [Sulfuracidifex tepidarius]|uniref:Reverse gyrase n=2 Tax=Sulfuracidifex tepidarius TaxID=1294262 RepID=A0A510E382_9CREN|nr:Reverse gyrase [Sulfuracidifex tepidarius]BBG26964.1 Reverse gyrase [Sulfuracidifex tepidarius]